MGKKTMQVLAGLNAEQEAKPAQMWHRTCQVQEGKKNTHLVL